MQFAGQRTDQDLNPIGEPVNLLVKLTNDTLPSPGAIMVTKITPQQTQADGLTEAEFCRYVSDKIFTENTCAVGYNSVRFDDEFMRHTFWRNFFDPYEWQWKDGRSRWDLLDVVRLTRALRPEGIIWPTQEITVENKERPSEQSKQPADSKPATSSASSTKTLTVETNRLELITKLNNIAHTHAHDALYDVEALISVTKLIKKKQPKLYDFLYKMRDKKQVAKLVNLDNKQPFVYACGRYSGQHHKTTVAFPLTAGRNGNVLVFDLRYNLDEELAKRHTATEPSAALSDYQSSKSSDSPKGFFPIVKELCLNKCPAIAPLNVLNAETTENFADKHQSPLTQTGWERIGLTSEQVEQNLKSLLAHPEFAEQQREAYENRPAFPPASDPEAALYDAFLSDHDRIICNAVRNADASRLADFHPEFSDERLPELLLHYKAKNFPTSLAEAEQPEWESYRLARLNRQLPSFTKQMQDFQNLLASGVTETSRGQKIDPFILEELSLWYQSLQPDDY